jgi:hypothetical protein
MCLFSTGHLGHSTTSGTGDSPLLSCRSSQPSELVRRDQQTKESDRGRRRRGAWLHPRLLERSSFVLPPPQPWTRIQISPRFPPLLATSVSQRPLQQHLRRLCREWVTMEAIRKQASKFREQVARQQQVWGHPNPLSHDLLMDLFLLCIRPLRRGRSADLPAVTRLIRYWRPAFLLFADRPEAVWRWVRRGRHVRGRGRGAAALQAREAPHFHSRSQGDSDDPYPTFSIGCFGLV